MASPTTINPKITKKLFHRLISTPILLRKNRVRGPKAIDRAKDKISTYSGGMKRRLSIGRVLLHNPEIIMLDEPTLGVDVQGSHRIWDYIKNFAKEGKTVLVTTNVMSEADYLCSRLLIIDYGKNIAQGTPIELKESLGQKEIIIKKKPSLDDVFLHYTGRQIRDQEDNSNQRLTQMMRMRLRR